MHMYKQALLGGVLGLLAQPAMATVTPTIPAPSTLSLLAAAGVIGVVLALRGRRK